MKCEIGGRLEKRRRRWSTRDGEGRGEDRYRVQQPSPDPLDYRLRRHGLLDMALAQRVGKPRSNFRVPHLTRVTTNGSSLDRHTKHF